MRVPSQFIVGAMILALGAASVDARTAYDNRDKKAKARINNFALTERHMATPDDEASIANNYTPVRNSLGRGPEGSAAASPGMTIKISSEDWHYSHKGRKVDQRGTNDVHFVYSDQPGLVINTDGYGYNVYDPTGGGSWPQGFQGGCRVQAADQRGLWPNASVGPQGYVVMYGSDNTALYPSTTFENRIYYQGAQHDCFWGAGNRVPRSLYSVNVSATPANQVGNHPQIETQVIGSDTVTHVLVHSSGFAAYNAPSSLTSLVIKYFRKVSWASGDSTSWTNARTIDTSGYRGTLVASRTSSKVAAIYLNFTSLGLTNNNGGDQDVMYRQSTDGGVTWAAPVNVTNYNRNVASYAPWIETHGMYDSNDKLHILWNANPWPADVYDSTGFFFGDFSASLFHWSDASGSGVISRIKNCDLGIAWNTNVCGFGGSNMLYLGQFSIGECDGNLYTIWSQTHDVKNFADLNDTITNIFDDCATAPGSGTSRVFQANGEIWLSISSDLTGMLWDAPRNLTNSYTPACDSATGGGLCEHDMKATLSTFGQNATGLTFPGAATVVPTGGTAGNWFLNMMYVNDHYPASVINPTPKVTNNDIKWVRLACVDPVTAASIAATPAEIGYPSYSKPGVQVSVPVTVTNDGNATLSISSIGNVETSPASNWLGTSVSSLTVPAGVGNTGTFNIILNQAGIIAAGPVALNGYVYMLSNAANNDSLTIAIDNYIVADTIVDIKWDTVRTNVSGTPKVAMVVGSHGNTGRGGLGRVNLDYAANGAFECDTTKDVYMYDGGPLLIRQVGASYSFTSSAFQGTFANPVSFKPVNNPSRQPASLSTAAYDGFYTGQSVNEDSTIAMERTFFAPKNGTDSSDFMIICTKFYSYTGSAYTDVMFADIIDWDIPADVGATNKTGIQDGTVYVRGTDTGAAGACPNNNRFGAQRFLGMKWSSEAACANDVNLHGQYAARNDSDIFTAPNGVLDSNKAWNKAGALTGSTALPPSQDSTDVHIVTTYKHDVTLPANDTFIVYTAVTTIRAGSASNLADNFAAACAWYQNNLRTGCTVCGCCIGSVGNVDADPGDAVDISDLTVLIDHLFINNAPLVCPDEGNTDGNPGVDISDLTVLIDHLFINNNPLPAC